MSIVTNEYIINDAVWRCMANSSIRRYSNAEAVGSVIQHIMTAGNEGWQTSVNQLSKQWKWDNHQTSDFLQSLCSSRMVELQRMSRSVFLKFTDRFKAVVAEFPMLFTILSSGHPKTSRCEAIVYLLDKGIKSYRSAANELGWTHHTVMNLVSFLQSHGLTVKGACTENDLGRDLG